LLLIEKHLLEAQTSIECWFRSQWKLTPAPFYASVDLRNAGFKLAPVDTNLFPAGFNNLNPAFEPLSVQAIQTAIERMEPPVTRVVIVPESHTRNLFYLESLATLQALIEKAGFDVRLGSINPEITAALEVESASGRKLTLEPLLREGLRVGVKDFDADLVLLNNDMSGGRPKILEGIEQTICPAMHLGWDNRLKSKHFAHYKQVSDEFAERVGLDPWLIQPLFSNCGMVDFMKGEGIECLKNNVSSLVTAIQRKYDEYGITREPFVIVKADAGTYGMGVMTVRKASDLSELNRKQRTKMSKSKEGLEVENVILQEGVYTDESWGKPENVAEPVVYMIDHNVVGGFYRVHTSRSVTESLNAPGMRFEPLAFAESCNTPALDQAPDAQQNRFYAYGVIARLALVAAAREGAE
jgi:glutamate--cysteine ligase